MKYLMALMLALTMTGCASSQFANGKLEDSDELNNMVDEFTESDAQILAVSSVKQIDLCPKIINANQSIKTVMVDKVQNRTEEHIDMNMMMSQIQTALVRSGKLEFIQKDARESLEEEYQYNEGGAVSTATQKKRGNQIGANYIIQGALYTKVQEVGKVKTLYYQLNLNVIDTERGTVACATEEKHRKRYKKGRY